MKPINIRVRDNKIKMFDEDLVQNVELTKLNPEIQCSIQNVETAFLELDRLAIMFRTLPCLEQPKYIRRDIQRLSKYIKAESKFIKKTLTKLRKNQKKGLR